MLDDGARRRDVQLWTIAACSCVVVAVVYVIAIRTHLGQRLDDVAFARRTVVTAATTRRTDRLLGTISTASLLVFGGAIVAVALARRRLRLAIAAGTAMSGAVVTAEVLKLRILTRPQFTDIVGVAGNTYPSGHATIGMVLALGSVMVAPVHLRRPALVAAAFASTAFGTAVLASGWHRPSDTIGGYFVALAWFAAVAAVLARADRRDGAPAGRAVDPPLSRSLLAAAAISVFGLLMFTLWKSVSATGLRTVVYAAPYIAACIAIDVAGLLIVGTFYVVERTSVGAPAPAHASDHHVAS